MVLERIFERRAPIQLRCHWARSSHHRASAKLLQLLAEGKRQKRSRWRWTQRKDAENHRSNIMRKLQLHSVSDLVMYPVRNNIVHVIQPTLE